MNIDGLVKKNILKISGFICLILIIAGMFYLQSHKVLKQKSLENVVNSDSEKVSQVDQSQQSTTINGSSPAKQENTTTPKTSTSDILSLEEQPMLNPVSDFKLPGAPEGFRWQRLEEINGWILSPNDWYFLHETKNSTQAYFLTKEKIEGSSGFFQTGISLNVIAKSGIPGGDSYSYAKAYTDALIQNGASLTEPEGTLGEFSFFKLQQEIDGKEGKKLLYTQVMANHKTSSLYILMFETPTSELDSITPVANEILKQFVFDDDI